MGVRYMDMVMSSESREFCLLRPPGPSSVRGGAISSFVTHHYDSNADPFSRFHTQRFHTQRFHTQ